MQRALIRLEQAVEDLTMAIRDMELARQNVVAGNVAVSCDGCIGIAHDYLLRLNELGEAEANLRKAFMYYLNTIEEAS